MVQFLHYQLEVVVLSLHNHLEVINSILHLVEVWALLLHQRPSCSYCLTAWSVCTFSFSELILDFSLHCSSFIFIPLCILIWHIQLVIPLPILLLLCVCVDQSVNYGSLLADCLYLLGMLFCLIRCRFISASHTYARVAAPRRPRMFAIASGIGVRKAARAQ